MSLRLLRTTVSLVVLGALLLTVRAEAAAAGATAELAPQEPRKLALTTSLVTPFFAAYVVEGTARASSSFGLLMNASYLRLEHPRARSWRSYAGTLGAGLDYYLPGELLRRAYVEAIGELVFASWHHRPSGQVARLGIGYTAIALVGYRYVFTGGPVLDVGAGAVAIHFPRAEIELAGAGSISATAFTNFYPALKLNVGWAF